MPEKDITSIAFIPGFDFNNDGIGDIVFFESGGGVSTGTDPEGKKVEISYDYSSYRPFLGVEDYFLPFDKQDECAPKAGSNISWLYIRSKPFFYNEAKTKFFSSGQWVIYNDQFDNIAGFTTTILEDSDPPKAKEVKAVLSGCKVAKLDELQWATEDKQIVDFSKVLAAAGCDSGCENIAASPIEEALAVLFKKAKTTLSSKDAAKDDVEEYFSEYFKKKNKGDSILFSISSDFRLRDLLIEGFLKYSSK